MPRFLIWETRGPTFLHGRLRFHPVREYLIAYAPEEEPLIVGVLHGGRSPRVIAALVRGRK